MAAFDSLNQYSHAIIQCLTDKQPLTKKARAMTKDCSFVLQDQEPHRCMQPIYLTNLLTKCLTFFWQLSPYLTLPVTAELSEFVVLLATVSTHKVTTLYFLDQTKFANFSTVWVNNAIIITLRHYLLIIDSLRCMVQALECYNQKNTFIFSYYYATHTAFTQLHQLRCRFCLPPLTSSPLLPSFRFFPPLSELWWSTHVRGCCKSRATTTGAQTISIWYSKMHPPPTWLHERLRDYHYSERSKIQQQLFSTGKMWPTRTFIALDSLKMEYFPVFHSCIYHKTKRGMKHG